MIGLIYQNACAVPNSLNSLDGALMILYIVGGRIL
jgi:hypothetical protein